MLGLGDLAGGGFFSEARDVSADGAVIVGTSAANSGLLPYRAFRWTADAGMVALPDVPGVGPTINGDAVSGNGEVAFGAAFFNSDADAFAWDAFHGSRSVAGLLIEQGVDLAGWRLKVVRGASYDGLTIAGLGLNPEGRQQPWTARFNPGTFVPEPSTMLLVVTGCIAIAARGQM
jgi:probable HAF family extracellular repeat protein